MKKKITQFVTKFGGTMAAFAVMVAARIISEADADMYMNFSISYDTCKYCDYIISWNTVSDFCFLHTI